MHPQFAGSKRQARIAARDQRRVDAVKTRLQKIYALSKLVKDEDELNVLLASIPDEAVREETKKLIEPFLLFTLRKVELATPSEVIDLVAAPEKATEHRVLQGPGPAPLPPLEELNRL